MDIHVKLLNFLKPELNFGGIKYPQLYCETIVIITN